MSNAGIGSMRLSKDQRASLMAALLEVVAGAYAGWPENGRREPRLSVSVLRESVSARCQILLAAGWADTEWSTADLQQRTSWVRSALESLRRAGLLGSTIGLGCDGQEARLYEPAGLL